MPSVLSTFFCSPFLVFTTAALLRLILLLYGRWQDAHSPVKYTDVDYLVFTDAARFISRSRSPYDRATYRYTPLLAWLLYPTTWGGLWFEFGKVLFALGDLVTGWMIYKILKTKGMGVERSLKFAAIWLLNPMVANISTRGSSEGLVAVIVVAMLWATLSKRWVSAGALLGLGVHVKIYPFVYGASIFWWLGPENVGSRVRFKRSPDDLEVMRRLKACLNRQRMIIVYASFLVFMAFNLTMYCFYKFDFLENTFSYHLTRIDHRHNFSVYSTALHLTSAYPEQANGLQIGSFIPQLLLSVVAIPLLFAKKDLPGTMLAQTFAFVTFNKVCTSQYFLWYMVFLPFYLPGSSPLRKPRLGLAALVLWVLGQAAWLQQGYNLEFLGKSTFVPGLWLASVAFFLINCWILGVIVRDVAASSTEKIQQHPAESKKNS